MFLNLDDVLLIILERASCLANEDGLDSIYLNINIGYSNIYD